MVFSVPILRLLRVAKAFYRALKPKRAYDFCLSGIVSDLLCKFSKIESTLLERNLLLEELKPIQREGKMEKWQSCFP